MVDVEVDTHKTTKWNVNKFSKVHISQISIFCSWSLL